MLASTCQMKGPSMEYLLSYAEVAKADFLATAESRRSDSALQAALKAFTGQLHLPDEGSSKSCAINVVIIHHRLPSVPSG
eukprot:1153498-Pelagomonas_calceolata.AAC.2